DGSFLLRHFRGVYRLTAILFAQQIRKQINPHSQRTQKTASPYRAYKVGFFEPGSCESITPRSLRSRRARTRPLASITPVMPLLATRISGKPSSTALTRA